MELSGFYNRVGSNLRMAREARKLRQADVATKLGISNNSYSEMERGILKVNTYRLRQLCELFKVSPAKIILWDDLEEKNECGEEVLEVSPERKELIALIGQCPDAMVHIIYTVVSALVNDMKR